MFPTRFFCRSGFAPRYFPRNSGGAEPEPQPDLSASMLAARMRMFEYWRDEEELIIL